MKMLLLSTSLVLAGGAVHASQIYLVDFSPLNGEDVTGSANLELEGNMLDISILASGLTPNQVHLAHIHGFSSQPVQSSRSPVPPLFDPLNDQNGSLGASNSDTTPDDDTQGNGNSAFVNDGDGFTELFEAAPLYGPILYTFGMALDGFGGVFVGDDGVFEYTENDIDVSTFVADGYDLGDFEIVLHGTETDFEPLDLLAPGFGGGVDGNNFVGTNYNAVLPAAVGGISPIPLPAGAWLILAALGGLVALRRWT